MNTPCLRAPCVTLFLLITAPAVAPAQTGQVYTADDAHSIGHRTEATADFRQVTRLDPDNTDAIEWLRHTGT